MASSGFTQRLLELGDRRAEPVGGRRAPRRRADIAAEVVERDRVAEATRSLPRWLSPAVPEMPAGTSGTPASSAIRAAPERQRASCRFRRPFSRRVPSGNMTTMCPSRQSRTAVSTASRSRSPRRTGNAPQDAMNGPEREPEQLGLRHEAEVPPREERHPERPGVDVREVVGREDVSALCRKPFEALPALPKDQPQHGVAEPADERGRASSDEDFRTSTVPVSPVPDTCGVAKPRYGDPRTRPSAGKDPVIRPEKGIRGRTSSRHRRVSRQGKDHCRVPRRRLRRGIVDRPHPRSSEPRRRHSGCGEEGAVGPPRRQRRRRVPAALRRRPRQEEEGRRAQARAEELHRAPARDGRRPRGRGDRLAPARGPEPEGSRQADGLPRDHEGRDPARARRDPRDRRRPRRRAGDAADPRPALRLRGVARPLDEGRPAALRRSRAVGRDAARRRARARADEVRRRLVLGHRRHVRSRARSRRSSSGSRASASRRAATSATTASSRATCSHSTRTPRARSRPRSKARRSPSARSRRSRTGAARRRRS